MITRWRDAQAAVLESEEYKNNVDELQKLPPLDMLLAFEDYSRVLEREWEETQRRTAIEKGRKERKAREGFRVRALGNCTDLNYSLSSILPGAPFFSSRTGPHQSPDQMEDDLSTSCQRPTILESLGKPRIESSRIVLGCR